MKIKLTLCAFLIAFLSMSLFADELEEESVSQHLPIVHSASAPAASAPVMLPPAHAPMAHVSESKPVPLPASGVQHDIGNLLYPEPSSKPRVSKITASATASAVASSKRLKPEASNASAAATPTAAPDYAPAQELLLSAMSLIGVKYKWGGNTPQSGLDCSGFIKYVFGDSLNIVLPRTALGMSKIGDVIENKDELKPGDLVFFNTLKRKFSHVGIYLGDNRFIHAPRKGRNIEITQFDNAYWTKRFNGARRIKEFNDTQIDLDSLLAARPTPPPNAALGANKTCRKVSSMVKGKKVMRTVCSAVKPAKKPAARNTKKSKVIAKKPITSSNKKTTTPKAPTKKSATKS